MHVNKLEMAQICFTRVVGLNPEVRKVTRIRTRLGH